MYVRTTKMTSLHYLSHQKYCVLFNFLNEYSVNHVQDVRDDQMDYPLGTHPAIYICVQERVAAVKKTHIIYYMFFEIDFVAFCNSFWRDVATSVHAAFAKKQIKIVLRTRERNGRKKIKKQLINSMHVSHHIVNCHSQNARSAKRPQRGAQMAKHQSWCQKSVT